MGDDRDRRQLLLVDELGDVIDMGRRRIAAVGGPLAVAMAPEVGRDDVTVRPQLLRHPIPVAAMIATAVQQEEGRRVRIAPVNIMQPQARSEEHTSELQSLMRISYAVFCLKKKKQ